MIWCVENAADARNIQLYTLRSFGFDATGFESADDAWDALKHNTPELILLSCSLPDADMPAFLQELRVSKTTRDIPVIVTGGKTEADIVRYLDMGADDCLWGSFGMMEVIARIKSVFRRYGCQKEPPYQKVGGIMFFADERMVKVNGEFIDLTYKEFELLRCFFSHVGEVLSRKELYEAVWKKAYSESSRTIDVHVRTLRKKLKGCGNLIESVKYIGYRMKRLP